MSQTNGAARARPLHQLTITVVQTAEAPNGAIALGGDTIDDLGLSLDILEDAERALRHMHRERRLKQPGLIKPAGGIIGG